MSAKAKLLFENGDVYVWENGMTMRRENGTYTPEGNEVNRRWVIRDSNGDYIDCDQYRHDIAPRHNLDI